MPSPRFIAALVCCSAIGGEAGALSASLRTLAMSGMPAAGLPAGIDYHFFGMAELAESGAVAIPGFVRGPGVGLDNDQAIWGPDGAGGLRLVVREGDPAPGMPDGTRFGAGLGGARVNAAGRVAFFARVTPPGASAAVAGIWISDPGAELVLVARQGGPAPGAPAGVPFSYLDSPVMNAAGQLAFRGGASHSGINGWEDGIWITDSSGEVTLLVRDDSHAPDLPTGARFDRFDDPVLNAAGEVAFRAIVTGGGATFSNHSGVWGPNGSGGLGLIARGSMTAVTDARISDSGDTAFGRARLGVGTPGEVAIAVSPGDEAPGTGGGRFQGFFGFDLEADGRLAFGGRVEDAAVPGSPTGIWVADPTGGLLEVAFDGDAIRGQQDLWFANVSLYPTSNALGDVVFTATVAGPGIDINNDEWIFFADAAGRLHPIAREGELLEVAPGVLAVIGAPILGLNPLNDAREVLFSAFVDEIGTAWFLARVAEPGAPGLLALALVAGAIAARADRRRLRGSHALGVIASAGRGEARSQGPARSRVFVNPVRSGRKQR